jgi:membrane-bound lytic murein transglycosylase A
LNSAWRSLRYLLLLVYSLVLSAPAQALEAVSYAALPGWAEDNHAAALKAFQRSCQEILAEGSSFGRPTFYGSRREDWLEVCRLGFEATHAKTFFEANFMPFKVLDQQRPEGLFTGYYEPEAMGSRTPNDKYDVPVYRKPADLVAFDKAQQHGSGHAYGRINAGKPQPYFTRREIEQGALRGKGLEIVWLKDWADAFFMHIQGSGRVRLEDGSVIRLAYGAKSGLPYTGIGGILVERGAFTRDEMSMQATRSWMATNPQAARELMWENQSFIFFREVELADPTLGAIGAQHVQLTPLRSIAVDRDIWPFGMPVWLDTAIPAGEGNRLEEFRQLLIAQDTGSAIRGQARGDVYFGFGDHAAIAAGHMKSPGVMIVLLPRAVAQGLGLVP